MELCIWKESDLILNYSDHMVEVLYEDNHLLVVNKPAGLLTQPSGTLQDSLETQCKAWIKEQFHKPGEVFLAAVHRLDKPASGIVLFARTSKALARLNTAVREKQFKKNYYALVEGAISPSEGYLEHFLIHEEFQARVASSSEEKAKLSKLHYRVVQQYLLWTLLDIDLETGRYHQIRAQLAAAGHPIVGDRKYGSQMSFTPDAIALHHYSLQFPHPVQKTILHFESPVPISWGQV